MDKNVQKLLSWSGVRTKKPAFEIKYKRIVDAISQTLMEKFKEFNRDVLKSKVQDLFANA